MSAYKFSESLNGYPVSITTDAGSEDDACSVIKNVNEELKRKGYFTKTEPELTRVIQRYPRKVLGNFIEKNIKAENAGYKSWYRVTFDVKHNGQSSYIIDINADTAKEARLNALTLFTEIASGYSHLFHIEIHKIPEQIFTTYTWYKMEREEER